MIFIWYSLWLLEITICFWWWLLLLGMGWIFVFRVGFCRVLLLLLVMDIVILELVFFCGALGLFVFVVGLVFLGGVLFVFL